MAVKNFDLFEQRFEEYREWRENNIGVRLRPNFAMSKDNTCLYNWRRALENDPNLQLYKRVLSWEKQNNERLYLDYRTDYVRIYQKAIDSIRPQLEFKQDRIRKQFPEFPRHPYQYFEQKEYLNYPLYVYFRLSDKCDNYPLGRLQDGYIRLIADLFNLKELFVRDFLKVVDINHRTFRIIRNQFKSLQSERRTDIVCWIFGINDDRFTAAEIAKFYGTTESNIGLIKARALEVLRKRKPIQNLLKGENHV